jgi:nitroreductase
MHDLFKGRRSVRKFLDKKVTDDQIQEILSAAMVAPSGRHSRPWEFIVVKDREKRERLAKLRSSGKFIRDSPVCIVVLGNERQSNLWVQDCSLASGHIYLEVTNQGLGTCWVNVKCSKTDEGEDAEEEVKKILGIPEDLRVLCMLPIGYPKEEMIKHNEDEYEERLVHQEEW